MAIANVGVSFECADLAEAESLIKSWQLHDGCEVQATVIESVPETPARIENGEMVSVESINAAQVAQDAANDETQIITP